VNPDESEEQVKDSNTSGDLFQGKFIPNDPFPHPLVTRIAIGIGVGVLISVMAALSMNVLNHLGVWLTLLIVSAFTATSLMIWILDSIRHPATAEGDDE
jgi:hypothetical protein